MTDSATRWRRWRIVVGVALLGSARLTAANPISARFPVMDGPAGQISTITDRDALNPLASRSLPIVFAHGLGISGQAYEALLELRSLFARHHRPFFIALTPVNGRVEERAAILRHEIDRLVPTGRLHLIGHSMGGLDARLALRDPVLASRVSSLTTMSTPHHGSPVADYVVRHVDELEGDPVLQMWLERLFGGDLRAARQLTTSNIEQHFNAEVVDAPGVQYFSMGFFIPAPVQVHSIVPWLWAVHAVVAEAGFPNNDGMVSVESARWGQSLGVFPGDHYSETSPLPLIGGPGHLELFLKVLTNIEQKVEGESSR